MTEMLQRRHDPQRRDGYDRKHDRNIKAAKTNRRADSTGNPEAGGRGGALDRILEAQNGPPPINPCRLSDLRQCGPSPPEYLQSWIPLPG